MNWTSSRGWYTLYKSVLTRTVRVMRWQLRTWPEVIAHPPDEEAVYCEKGPRESKADYKKWLSTSLLLWSWKEVVQCPIMFCPVCPSSGESAPPDIFPTINCSQRAFFFNALRHFCYNVSPCRFKKPLCLCKTNYTRSPARARELYSIRASLWL